MQGPSSVSIGSPAEPMDSFTVALCLLCCHVVFVQITDEDDRMVGYPRVLVFARGGHFVHRSHTDIVTDAVIQLMTHVSNGNSATAAVPRQEHS